ncbi:MAG TPA: methyltransferase domain-containing protein [Blastocatellia bacterium]|jgi:SAM-dependent methyltransferase
METSVNRHGLARPYSRLANAYDETIGLPAFRRIRLGFEALARRYGLRFRSAADIGCGTGLFARYLNRRWGAQVWAVDISPDMLRVAEVNCRDADVRLLRQDIRRLRLPEQVDLVTSNFDALNHLTGEGDLRVAFQRVAENLRPGGHLYFDLVTPCQPPGVGMAYVRRMKAANKQVIQRIRWDMARRTISVFALISSIGAPRPALEVHRERAYSFAEVGRWLLDAGFVIRGAHDALTLKPASGCPARIIVIAQKVGRR